MIYILIQVPGVQNFARKKVVSYLENKLHTRVQIAKLSLDFPKKIVLEGVYFEDQHKDTLFSGGKIAVDIALFKLISSKVEISSVELKDLTANISRTGKDTTFNYQYIIDAFVTPKDPNKPVDTSAGMVISVDKILLNNVGGSFIDNQTGIDFLVRLGKFQTAFKKFNLEKMNFSLPDIDLENVVGHMYQNKPLLTPKPAAEIEAKSDEPFKFDLALENIDIKNIHFDYKNDVSVMAAKLDLGELSGKVKSIDLATLDIKLDNVKLHNTTAAIDLGKSEQTKIVKEEINKNVAAQANNPWKVMISNIDLENNNLSFNDENKPRIPSGMDYGHLKIDSLTVKGNSLVITPTAYTGNITDGHFTEKSGFNLKQLKTEFAYSDTGATLNKLYVETDKTLIRDNITVKYPSLDAITKDMGQLYLDANFVKTNLAAKDILIFAPQLQTNLKGNENAVVHIDARVKGYLNDLTIPGFEVSGIGSTSLSMSGNIKGLPDVNKTRYDFDIANFQTTKKDLDNFLPPGTIPPNIRIPDAMKVSGSFKGLATNFTTDILLQTNKGDAKLTGFLNSNNETYNLKGSLNNVDVGYLTKQDTLVGKVTMDFAAKGQGFKPTTMNTNANARVKSAFIKGYDYKNIAMVASVHRGYTVVDATVADKSLALHMNGEALIDDKFATNVKLRLMLDSILLKPLGFATTDQRIHGNVIADMPSIDMNAPEGKIEINDLVVFNDGKIYHADTITAIAATTDTGKIITLNSQIATATLKGDYNLATIGTGAMQVINKYYNLGIKDSAITKDKWNLSATIIPDSLLFAFVPSIAGTDTIKVNANFDGSEEKIDLLVNAPKIQMGTQTLDSLTIVAGNTPDQFNYIATINTAGSNSFRLQKTQLDGSIKDDIINTKLNIKDIDGKDKYQLGARIEQKNTAIVTNLTDSLMLDYDKWAVDKTNYIQYDSSGIIVHNFTIDHGGQSLSINSKSENVHAPIDVILKDFRIKTLTNLAEQEDLAMDGLINGNVAVKDAMTAPIFTSDLTIENLSYGKDTVGNIVVKVDNETANAFTAALSITGKGNDIKLDGKYYTGEGRMDMDLNINNLNMSTIRTFSFGALNEADGSLKGNMAIKGTTEKPDLNGSLHFEKAHITPQATGEKLLLSDEAITISSKDISFNRFTVLDSAGNKAVVDGKIFTDDYKTYSFGLRLFADNFRVLTAPPRQNALYYGTLNMDMDVSVKGTLTAPSINADLKINKNTDITFVLPSVNPELQSREGVVEFIDVNGPGRTDSIFYAALDTITNYPALAGMDITGTLQSDTAAQITLVIDERSGDALKIRGKADLAGGIDKSGKISLTGNYQLQSGSYQLSLSLLKREFIIQQGSTLTWTGDPTSANVNITAIYVANTQPVNLLQSEISNLSASDINKYKAKIPFNVLLKMNGELLKPVITFDIELPEDQKSKWQNVETKLEQVRRDDAELNKQVFALLLLGRFVQENPLQNSADGTSLASTAKSSVSRLLTEQLNNLAGSLVKGVDLNFGVNSEDDYSSGARTSRTDLTVGVSKNLLNDRLRVSVGSNFELEGPANNNQNASNIAGDVAVDYLLSKDGRYLLRAYRRNQYEGVVEGQVVESGVGFIFTLNFNEFKEIFYRKTDEQKMLEKLEKEKQKAFDKAEQDKKDAKEKAAKEKQAAIDKAEKETKDAELEKQQSIEKANQDNKSGDEKVAQMKKDATDKAAREKKQAEAAKQKAIKKAEQKKKDADQKAAKEKQDAIDKAAKEKTTIEKAKQGNR
ncbi:MAG: translocation/assembly module TamB domain-containing protein [Ferruginibacter sp.]